MNISAALKEAKGLIDEENFDKAVSLLDDIISVEEDNYEAYFLKGKVLLRLDDREGAIKSFTRTTELKPDFPNGWYYLLGSIAFKEDPESYKDLTPVLKKMRTNTDIQISEMDIIDAMVDNEKISKALSYVEYLSPFYENEKYLLNFKGAILSNERGMHEEGIEAFDRALDIDRDYGIAHFNKGITLRRLGEYERSLESFESSIRIDDYWQAYLNKGYTFLEMKEPSKAVDEFKDAMEKGKNYPEAFLDAYERLSEETSDRELVMDFLNSLINKYEKELEILFELLVKVLDRGEIDLFMEYFEKYRESLEDIPQYKFLLTSYLIEKGRIEEAKGKIDEIKTEERLDNDSFYWRLGNLLLNMEERDDAVGMFDRYTAHIINKIEKTDLSSINLEKVKEIIDQMKDMMDDFLGEYRLRIERDAYHLEKEYYKSKYEETKEREKLSEQRLSYAKEKKYDDTIKELKES